MREWQDKPERLENDGTIEDLFEKLEKLDPKSLVETWMKEQGKKDRLNLCQWLSDRCHYFPHYTEVPTQLEIAIKTIQDPSMHPIEKAARIWYDIVRIHISHEANKRTGKAIGSAILLSHGYLPPRIGKESTKEYINVLQQGFEKEDGYEPFVQFIAKKVDEIQNEKNLS